MKNNLKSTPKGLLLVNKPTDWTSHDVVAKVRTLLPRKTKVGHTGTLDPFATGLLILLVGKEYTKQSDAFLKLPKTYIATVQWCSTSTTHDPEGEITSTKNCMPPTKQDIQNILPKFTGDILQIPPMHSAIKKDGKRLYTLARKGQEIKRDPRPVTVHNIEIVEHNSDKKQTVLNIHVSSGTYIRSLASDIGEALDCGGYLTALHRTSIQQFSVENAHTVDEIKKQPIEELLQSVN